MGVGASLCIIHQKQKRKEGETNMTTAEEIVLTTDEEIVEQNGHFNIVDVAQQVLAEHDSEQTKDNPALIELRIVEERQRLGRRHPDMLRALELDETDPVMAENLTREFYESITEKNIKKLRKEAGRFKDNSQDMFEKTLGAALQHSLNELVESDAPGVHRIMAGLPAGNTARTVINRSEDGAEFEVKVATKRSARSNNDSENRPRAELYFCTQIELTPDKGDAVVIEGREYNGGKSASHAFCVDYAVASGAYETNGLDSDGMTIIADKSTPFDATTAGNSIARYTVDGGAYNVAAGLLKNGIFKTVSFLTREGDVVQHMEMAGDVVGAWRKTGQLVAGAPESPDMMIREWATKNK